MSEYQYYEFLAIDRPLTEDEMEAEHIFEKMLWLNPSDNQGVRFLIDEVKAKTSWQDRENE